MNRRLKGTRQHHPPLTVKARWCTSSKRRKWSLYRLLLQRLWASRSEVFEPCQRFSLSQLREELDIMYVPTRLLLRGDKGNPFEKHERSSRGPATHQQRDVWQAAPRPEICCWIDVCNIVPFETWQEVCVNKEMKTRTRWSSPFQG